MTPFERVIPQWELETNCKYPRHESYVPGSTLWSIVLSVPCILSFLAWAVCNDCNDALEILLAWSLSLGLTGFLTNLLKLTVGRPRPDFFYRCFPDGVQTADFTCTGDAREVMDGRKSFPSGHSSLSFCSLGVCALWLAGRLEALSRRRGDAARLLTCVAPLCVALCVAVSRTCDYHHHWQDSRTFVSCLCGHSLWLYQLVLWLAGRLEAMSLCRGDAARLLTVAAPLCVALCVAVSRTCDYHHHWQDELLIYLRLYRICIARSYVRWECTVIVPKVHVLVGSILGLSVAYVCYRQYYNSISSELAGVPHVISSLTTRVSGRPDISPAKQYYNSISSELAGAPHVISSLTTRVSGRPDISPAKQAEGKDGAESTPLLVNGGVKRRVSGFRVI
ncbi:unnamed protein product [Plutella xylostella]|uniref:(diamondback moth) hypothetical protein n=1 Tax=Plutella xylostella TaxID=51655 RepID=A0A8S4GDC1_PLUXY|nr:unnamed protein product [Plutella xylostella]